MPHKFLARLLAGTTLLAVLVLSTATPALAFDGRGGQTVTIAAGEVVNDDLYITAGTVVINGTVKGDVVALASTVTINGTVEGSLMAAGQDVIINGTVLGDARIAGAALFLGANAKIGGDIVGAGASLETRPGSAVARDTVFAGGQALLAGAIARNVKIATGGLEISGTVAGNVEAYVGSPDQGTGRSPSSYMENTGVAVPSVSTGLSLDPTAKIGGDLNYTSSKQFQFPAGTVTGKTTHTIPQPSRVPPQPPTLAQRAISAGLDFVRLAVTLMLFGLLLGWLFPTRLKAAAERIKTAPLPSLGSGVLSIAAWCFSVLALFIAVILGAILFGILSLGNISTTIVVVGLLAIFALIVSFWLVVLVVSQVIVGTLAGQWILGLFNTELAANKYWPMILGVVMYALLASIPVLGFLVWLVVMLLGLGALWFFGRQLFEKKPVAVA